MNRTDFFNGDGPERDAPYYRWEKFSIFSLARIFILKKNILEILRHVPLRTVPNQRNERGMVLVAMVGLLIFLGLFAAVATSVVTTSNTSNTNYLEGAQALAIAHAGAEWYLEQLQGDTDWTNEGNQTKSFAEGSFTISISSAAATQVTFTSTGTVTNSLSNVNVQRFVTLTAQKLPPAFKFGLYQGLDPGANLQFTQNGAANPTQIVGDVWANGNVQINSPNTATSGKIYVPDNRDVTGTGTFTKKLVSSPYLSMPVITTTYYTNLIAAYNALLDANGSNTDTTVTAGQTFTVVGTMNRRDFTTTGNNVTINGSGTIVSNRNMTLHGGAGSLTVTPSAGGSITFLANRTLQIGNSANNPTINVSGSTTFYSRAATATGQLIRVSGSNTTLTGTFLIAQRRILVDTGADVIGGATLFVNYAGSNTNNTLDILADAADITTVNGTLISVAQNDPAFRIRNGGSVKASVVVTGLIYAYATAATGYCDLDDGTVIGSVVCNRYTGNTVRNMSITYSSSALPSTPPQGFDTFVVKKENSWDGL